MMLVVHWKMMIMTSEIFRNRLFCISPMQDCAIRVTQAGRYSCMDFYFSKKGILFIFTMLVRTDRWEC